VNAAVKTGGMRFVKSASMVACCFNDTAPPGCRRGWCWLCHKENVPVEGHHPLGRKLQASMGYSMTDLTFDLCLNCHKWISHYLLPLMEQQKERRENALKCIANILGISIAYWAILSEPQSIDRFRSTILESISHDRG
jgi:hypothetical protein